MRKRGPRSAKKSAASAARPLGRPTKPLNIDATPEELARAVLRGGAPKRPSTKK